MTALLLGLALGWPVARADDSPHKEQIWEGLLKVRPGVELRLIVPALDKGGDELTAVMDSPDEGLRGSSSVPCWLTNHGSPSSSRSRTRSTREN